MTKQRKDKHSTQFGLWLRKQTSISSRFFDAQNLDYVWFHYRKGWVILLEEKRYGTAQDFNQRDTHGVINQMMSFASGNEFNTAKGKRKIDYLGYYLVQFEKTYPDDSKWIKINGIKVDKLNLFVLLKFGVFFKETINTLLLPELFALIESKSPQVIKSIDVIQIMKEAEKETSLDNLV